MQSFIKFFVIFVVICSTNIIANESKNENKKITIKGDTLVILDASCDSGKGVDAFAKLKKDSKNGISNPKDCDINEKNDRK